MAKIVFAFDSFKGSLTSAEANSIASSVAHKLMPGSTLKEVEVADGGEGTAAVFVSALKYQWIPTVSVDPLGNCHKGRYAMASDASCAVIDCADSTGLPLVPPSERNPLHTSSFGTGMQIADALNRGCRHIVLAVGGTASVDYGTGILQALGYRFFDTNKVLLSSGGKIVGRVAHIDDSMRHPALSDTRFTILHDVNNPLYGVDGAAHRYGPQKGADTEMVTLLDKGAKSFCRIAADAGFITSPTIAGAGAGGGIGWAMATFLGATMEPGSKAVLEMTNFDATIADADLIITGEGRMDSTTICGKTPMAVLHAAAKHRIPVIGLGGQIDDYETLIEAGFRAVLPISPCPLSTEEAQKPETAAINLSRTIDAVLRLVFSIK